MYFLNFSIPDILSELGVVSNVIDDLNGDTNDFGGARLLPTCFDESTEILCLDENNEEKYISITELKKGTLVKTLNHGYKKIIFLFSSKLTNCVTDFRSCMYTLPKNHDMTKDLILTGGHSILVDSMNEREYKKNFELMGNEERHLDGKLLLLSSCCESFNIEDNENNYNIYHLILEDGGDSSVKYGVWANGVLTETISKASFLNELGVVLN
jgi:hypothetical protein